MGLESIIRKFCENACPRAFSHTDLSDVKVAIRDINMTLRSVPLCYNSRNVFTEKGVRAWGDILAILWRNEAALFEGGMDIVIEQFDGKAPRAKERAQAQRQQSNLNKREQELSKEQAGKRQREEEEDDADAPIPGPPALGSQEPVSSFRWPDEDDGLAWFEHSDRPQCSMDDIYYHPIAKRKWYEYVCRFLFFEAPVPRGKTLIVDCGAWKGLPLRRPVMVHVQAEDGKRIVQELEEHDPLWDHNENGEIVHHNYEEADDRIIYWVMHYAPFGHSIMVVTEDTDLVPMLMTTYRPRVEVLADKGRMGRLLLRRQKRVGTTTGGQPVKEPEVIDVDMIAAHFEMAFGGLISEGISYDGDWQDRLSYTDPVVLFLLMALLRKNDYSHELPRATFVNIIRAMFEHPELVRRLVDCSPPARYAPLNLQTPEEISAYLHMPREILVHWPTFLEFVKACYREVWRLRQRGVNKDGKASMRADQSPKQAPLPEEGELRAKCARVAWTLDKMVNGGKRKYVIANELERHEESNLPLYGYHEKEIIIEDPTHPDPDKRKRKKRIVDDAPRVHETDFYGVRQDYNNNNNQ